MKTLRSYISESITQSLTESILSSTKSGRRAIDIDVLYNIIDVIAKYLSKLAKKSAYNENLRIQYHKFTSDLKKIDFGIYASLTTSDGGRLQQLMMKDLKNKSGSFTFEYPTSFNGSNIFFNATLDGKEAIGLVVNPEKSAIGMWFHNDTTKYYEQCIDYALDKTR